MGWPDGTTQLYFILCPCQENMDKSYILCAFAISQLLYSNTSLINDFILLLYSSSAIFDFLWVSFFLLKLYHTPSSSPKFTTGCRSSLNLLDKVNPISSCETIQVFLLLWLLKINLIGKVLSPVIHLFWPTCILISS